jgi:hypothetical protein
MRIARLAGIAVLVVVALSARPARALQAGESCRLRNPLLVTVQVAPSLLEATFDPGTETVVRSVLDDGRLHVTDGNLKGFVDAKVLEAACAGTLRTCRALRTFSMFQSNRSDSMSWPVLMDAAVHVLRRGKVWAHLMVEHREGFAPVASLTAHCRGDGSGEAQNGTEQLDLQAAPVEVVDRGEGPGVLLLPFLVDGDIAPSRIEQLTSAWRTHLAFYRPDLGHLPAVNDRRGPWKSHVDEASRRARETGLAYAIVGKVALDHGDIVISIAVVEAVTGKTLKAVRARPTASLGDEWVEPALASLLPALAPAPSGPALPTTNREATRNAEDTTSVPAVVVKTTGEAWDAPWYANGWAYVAAAVGVGAGAGAWWFGLQAVSANDAANNAPAWSSIRANERERALAYAVTADALTATTTVAGVTALVLFIGRVGLSEPTSRFASDR